MNAQASISLDHVDKILGKAKRVDDLSLELAAGKIYGLLGPNGSGKTTILHLICGLYKPDRGTIRVLGMDPVRDHKAVRSAIGLLPQSTALYPELSARENLRFHAALYLPKGADAEARISEILQLVDLEARADEPVKNYSGGMSRRLGIGRALLNDPQILLLDEPTLGVDVQSTHRIHEYIRALGRAGKTVVVATNIMAEADALCDEVVIIDRGRKICAGAPQQLKDALGAATIQLRRCRSCSAIFTAKQMERLSSARRMASRIWQRRWKRWQARRSSALRCKSRASTMCFCITPAEICGSRRWGRCVYV